MMKQAVLLLTMMMACTSAWAQSVVASFAADRSYVAYYEQNFDSDEEFATWTVTSTASGNYTWHLSPGWSSDIAFTSINPQSKNSLCILYGSGQNESATSPAITIEPNSTLEFYNYFEPGFLYSGSWTLNVIEPSTQTTTKLLNQFEWAQKEGYDEKKWKLFSFDLSDYAGKTVQFQFVYSGTYGESELIDGFRVVRIDASEQAKITINQGDSVGFIDASTGEIASWQWTFEGGTPATSTEQNPVITYNNAGTFDVTLTVTGTDGTTSTYKREDYVTVVMQQPNAIIGMPSEGYLSPWVGCFIPTGVPVTFTDQSTGAPTSWQWQFVGATPSTSTDQNPTVQYDKKGTYSLQMTATNDAGSDTDVLLYAVQAGGAQYVWNIAPEENSDLEKVALGWYGNYAGSNWLGLTAFAEHFKQPLADATIDSVAVYFISATTVTPDTLITVSIYTVGEDGAPDRNLGSASIRADEIAYTDTTFEATMFVFDAPIAITDQFFVVIEGMPNNSMDVSPYTADDIAIACHRRGTGKFNSVWQLVEDQDEYGQGLGTFKWYENTDDPVSMAVCPVVSYDPAETGIQEITHESQRPVDNIIYNLQGARVSNPTPGIYIRNGKKVIIP